MTFLVRLIIAAILGAVALAPAAQAAPGDIDTSFGTLGNGKVLHSFGPADNAASAIVRQTDGKIVAVGDSGDFSKDLVVSRTNTNGTPDTGFGTGGTTLLAMPGWNETAARVTLQSDGKIVVAAESREASLNATTQVIVFRLNTNGTLDTGFGDNGYVRTNLATNASAGDVEIFDTNRIVVVGSQVVGGQSDFLLVAFDTDGNPDTSFSDDGIATLDFNGFGDAAKAVAIQGTSIYVAGERRGSSGTNTSFGIARFGFNGALDTNFATAGKFFHDFTSGADFATGIVFNSLGNLVAIGPSSVSVSQRSLAMVSLTASGSPAATFSDDGLQSIDVPGAALFNPTDIALGSGNSVFISGYNTVSGFPADFVVTKVLSNGDPDASFGIGGVTLTDFFGGRDGANGIALLIDGSLILGGQATQATSELDFGLAKYTNAGLLDTSYGTGGKVTINGGATTTMAGAMLVEANDKIVAAGRAGLNFGIARYNANGTVDSGFGTGGSATASFNTGLNQAYDVGVQSGGQYVVVGGTGSDWGIARFTSSGQLDGTFGVGGTTTTDFGGGNEQAEAVAVLPDNSFIVVGRANTGADLSDIGIAKYDASGTFDTSFATGGKLAIDIGNSDSAAAVAIQTNGKIVIGGSTDFGGSRFAVVRLNANGTLDTSFGTNGIVHHTVPSGSINLISDIDIQPNGRIVAVGRNSAAFAIARYLPTGALDPGFGGGGIFRTVFTNGFGIPYEVKVLENGKIVVGGGAGGDFATSDFIFIRYLTNGSHDESFGDQGSVVLNFGGEDWMRGFGFQSDGKIVTAGSGGPVGSDRAFALARHEMDAVGEGLDTDGDGVVDHEDLCPLIASSGADVDGDYIGDECDSPDPEPDTSVDGVSASGKTKVKLKAKSLSVPVKIAAAEEAVSATASGSLVIKVKGKKKQTIKLAVQTAAIAEGGANNFALKPAGKAKTVKKALKKARKLLSAKGKKKGKGLATIKIVVTDTAGNQQTITRKVKVK